MMTLWRSHNKTISNIDPSDSFIAYRLMQTINTSSNIIFYYHHVCVNMKQKSKSEEKSMSLCRIPLALAWRTDALHLYSSSSSFDQSIFSADGINISVTIINTILYIIYHYYCIDHLFISKYYIHHTCIHIKLACSPP